MYEGDSQLLATQTNCKTPENISGAFNRKKGFSFAKSGNACKEIDSSSLPKNKSGDNRFSHPTAANRSYISGK